MLEADLKLQDIVHRNASRIQAGMDRMLDQRAIQIDGVQFRLKTRLNLEDDKHALGLVLIGKDERKEWLPCHA